jgi:hypothetical protein
MRLSRKDLITNVFCLIPAIDLSVGLIALQFNLYSGYNGILKLTTLLPGIAIRLALIFLIFAALQSITRIIYLCILMVLLLSDMINLANGTYSVAKFILSSSHSIKLSLLIITYLLLLDPISKVVNPEKILVTTCIIYIFGICAGTLFGNNYSTYGGFGSTGWFIKGSANSISTVLLLTLLPTWLYLKKTTSTFFLILFVSICFIASSLPLTKGATLAYIVSALLFIRHAIPKWKVRVPFITAFSLTLAISSSYIVANSSMIDRLQNVYHYYDENIFYVLLSGRHLHLLHGKEIYLSELNFLQFIFGAGSENFRNLMSLYFNKPITVESDFFDILIINGLLSLTIILVILCHQYQIGVKGHYSYQFKVIFICTIVLAIIAGHVLFSGLALHLIAISTLYYKRKYRENTHD